jgi:hypothetical protein
MPRDMISPFAEAGHLGLKLATTLLSEHRRGERGIGFILYVELLKPPEEEPRNAGG